MFPFLVAAVAAAFVVGLVWLFRARSGGRSRLPPAQHVPGRPPAFDDNVQFTVYRPAEIEPRRWYSMLAFVHLSERPPDQPDAPDPVKEVARQAELLLSEKPGEYGRVTSDSLGAIPRSGELTLVPQMDGIEFNPARYTFRWEQPVHRAEFSLMSVAGAVPRTARGRLTIFRGPVIVGDVTLAIPVVVRATAGASTSPADIARPYRNIFASYSHRDMAVVGQFDAIAEALGDRYLRDVRDLRAGQVWSDELRRLIEHADVFQLFWSWNALASPFVRQEWEFALGLGRANFVRPVYWEDPLPAQGDLPPEALRRLHFHRLGSATPEPPALQATPPAAASSERRSRPAWRTPMAAAALLFIAALSWPIVMMLRNQAGPPPDQSQTVEAPTRPAQPAPLPVSRPAIGRISLPRRVLADGRPLAAGTYEVRLEQQQWAEFRRNGKVVAREAAVPAEPGSIESLVKRPIRLPSPGGVSVFSEKGDVFVAFNDGGAYYLAHLRVAPNR